MNEKRSKHGVRGEWAISLFLLALSVALTPELDETYIYLSPAILVFLLASLIQVEPKSFSDLLRVFKPTLHPALCAITVPLIISWAVRGLSPSTLILSAVWFFGLFARSLPRLVLSARHITREQIQRFIRLAWPHVAMGFTIALTVTAFTIAKNEFRSGNIGSALGTLAICLVVFLLVFYGPLGAIYRSMSAIIIARPSILYLIAAAIPALFCAGVFILAVTLLDGTFSVISCAIVGAPGLFIGAAPLLMQPPPVDAYQEQRNLRYAAAVISRFSFFATLFVFSLVGLANRNHPIFSDDVFTFVLVTYFIAAALNLIFSIVIYRLEEAFGIEMFWTRWGIQAQKDARPQEGEEPRRHFWK